MRDLGAPRVDSWKWRALVLLAFVGSMWIIHAADALMPMGISVAGHGVVPRTMSGLSGIATAPFIHANWEHLLANTFPLLVWGSLVLLRGTGEFIFVVLVSAFTSGMGSWLFGEPDTNHIGASGVALGLLGYLLFRSAFDRRISSLIITLAVAVAYGSLLLWSLLPSEMTSWTGHVFGLLGGFLAARIRYPRQPPRRDPRIDRALSVLEFPRRD
jgi:membrane associated rhomboid family serine protease